MTERELPPRPPTVVIFGGGVTGLSAAHELVERGFDVQVVEERTDPLCPDKPHLGGMARTQWARTPSRKVVDRMHPLRLRRARPILEFARGVPERALLFESGSAALSSETRSTLAGWAERLRRYVRDHVARTADDLPCSHEDTDVEEIVVEGYRDGSEAPDLGRARAAAVAAVLESELSAALPEPLERCTYTDYVTLTVADFGSVLDGDVRLLPPERRAVRLQLHESLLPGEHGYRFFPSFYAHLFDVMRRIPILEERSKTPLEIARRVEDYRRANVPAPEARAPRTFAVETGRTVYDNLVTTGYHAIVREDDLAPRSLPRRRTESVRELLEAIDAIRTMLDFTHLDVARYQLKLLEYLTSCTARRRDYENVSWYDFIGGESYSEGFKRAMDIWPQALNGMRAEEADARSAGTITAQIVLDQAFARDLVDATLNAPTSEAWFDPWRLYLEEQGVRFVNTSLEEIVWLEDQGTLKLNVTPPANFGRPHYVILALSVERAYALVAKFVASLPSEIRSRYVEGSDLEALLEFMDGWHPAYNEMSHPPGPLQHFTGVQYFLEHDLRFVRGHTYYAESEWGLTSVSQSQFRLARPDWRDEHRGVLSVDIGNMYTPSGDGKDAWSCSAHDLAVEAWRQVSTAVTNAGGWIPDPVWYHVDDEIVFGPEGGSVQRNRSPFLLNNAGMWELRPGRGDTDESIEYDVHFSDQGYQRLVLAGTYMRTRTRIVTMEAANESARHAVNAILRDARARLPEGRIGQPAPIWDPEERELPDLTHLKELDGQLHRWGLPHLFQTLDLEAWLRQWSSSTDLPATRLLSDVTERLLGGLRGLDFTAGPNPGDDETILDTLLESIRRHLETWRQPE